MQDLKLKRDNILTSVYRAKKRGELISPASGLYVIVPPEHQAYGCIPADEFVPILMDYMKADYYVALLSAAAYYGAAHQKSGSFQIISNKRFIKPLNFGQIHIECIYKKSITDLPIRNVTVNTGYLKVSTPEVTAMDLLRYSAKSGGLNHIATVLSELIESINPDKLLALAQSSDEKAWVQRLGYILEKIEPMDDTIAKATIEKLSAYLATQRRRYVPLANEQDFKNFERSKRWNIIENTTIESDL
jgi:predicted transcriptional regulator of viral defense system